VENGNRRMAPEVINAGVGMTIRLTYKGWKFYVESRYNYAWQSRIPTTFIPVTLGFRFN
jgi:hypothetical protein